MLSLIINTFILTPNGREETDFVRRSRSNNFPRSESNREIDLVDNHGKSIASETKASTKVEPICILLFVQYTNTFFDGERSQQASQSYKMRKEPSSKSGDQLRASNIFLHA